MRKGFVIRDRSVSSFPSKELTAYELRAQNSLGMKNFTVKIKDQQKISKKKEEQEIIKLKTNLQYALKMVVSQTMQSSKAKQQSMRSTKSKLFTQKKLMEMTEQLSNQKMERMRVEGQLLGLQNQLNRQQSEKKILKEKQQQTIKLFVKTKSELSKIAVLQQKLTEIQPLKSRIKTLQQTLRQQKLKSLQMIQINKKLQKQLQQIKQKIKLIKPLQQQHLQQIQLLERVNFDLSKKLNNFFVIENQYNKKIGILENQLNKMIKNYLQQQSLYKVSNNTLEQKLTYISQLETKLKQKVQQNKQLNTNLLTKTQQNILNEKKLAENLKLCKNISQNNDYLKKRNDILQQNQLQMRKTIESHLKISQQTNLYIVQRNNYVERLQSQRNMLKYNFQQLQHKFVKFQFGIGREENQIKQSYFQMLKQRNQLIFQIRQYKQQMRSKIIEFGQYRDTLQRKIHTYSLPIPSNQTFYSAIMADKTQQILILQSSNEQLLKIKKQMQDRIKSLQQLLQKSNIQPKKQIQELKIKNNQLIFIKNNLEKARAKGQIYQGIVLEQKAQIINLNIQLDRIKVQNAQWTQKVLMLENNIKNLNFKITEYESMMKQLDMQYLNSKKQQNERNFTVISDAIQKMKNGTYSLSYYLSCCYCHELATNFITVLPCGHNYCTKIQCKVAYQQHCYECDLGVEKFYLNKGLKQSAEKYKFLTLMIKQAQTNLVKAIRKQQY